MRRNMRWHARDAGSQRGGRDEQQGSWESQKASAQTPGSSTATEPMVPPVIGRGETSSSPLSSSDDDDALADAVLPLPPLGESSRQVSLSPPLLNFPPRLLLLLLEARGESAPHPDDDGDNGTDLLCRLDLERGGSSLSPSLRRQEDGGWRTKGRGGAVW